MNRKELVKRLKYMIKSVAPNSQTILYGSEARGEAKQNSDIEIGRASCRERVYRLV